MSQICGRSSTAKHCLNVDFTNFLRLNQISGEVYTDCDHFEIRVILAMESRLLDKDFEKIFLL